MDRVLLAVLILAILPIPLAAQGVDLSVEITADARSAFLMADYGVHVRWDAATEPHDVVLVIDTSAPVREIHLWDSGTACSSEAKRVTCVLPSVSKFDGGLYLRTLPETAGVYTATATVTSTTTDPVPSNNTAAASIDVLAVPVLKPYAVSEGAESENAADPGGSDALRVGVQNDGEAATNVVLRATLPEEATFVSAAFIEPTGGTCEVAPHEAVCRWSSISGFGPQFILNYITPDRDEGTPFEVRITVDADQPDADPEGRTFTASVPLRRRFNVTTTADDGRGSLRQAITDAGALCATTPCLIAFRTADAIRPLTPLPQVTGFVKIDARTTGGEIDGSMLTDGGAIFSQACELRVLHLRIRNFPGHAIETRDGSGCGYAKRGVFLIGNELTGNLRGIVSKAGHARIEENTIRNNRRAGIFVDGGWDVTINDNDISANGASGVFVNLSAAAPYYGLPPKATLRGNRIRGNVEWGLCRTGNGWVESSHNLYSGNRYMAIDLNLDFETPNREDDAQGIPNKPVLTSATYDPVRNVTLLRGKLNRSFMEIYASSTLSPGGFPQAERFVATTFWLPGGDAEVEIPGDLRGQWITALTHRSVTPDWSWTVVDTSELSNAVLVN